MRREARGRVSLILLGLALPLTTATSRRSGPRSKPRTSIASTWLTSQRQSGRSRRTPATTTITGSTGSSPGGRPPSDSTGRPSPIAIRAGRFGELTDSAKDRCASRRLRGRHDPVSFEVSEACSTCGDPDAPPRFPLAPANQPWGCTRWAVHGSWFREHPGPGAPPALADRPDGGGLRSLKNVQELHLGRVNRHWRSFHAASAHPQ